MRNCHTCMVKKGGVEAGLMPPVSVFELSWVTHDHQVKGVLAHVHNAKVVKKPKVPAPAPPEGEDDDLSDDDPLR